MKRVLKAIIICSGLLFAGYAGWTAIFQTIHVRYRLTIEVKAHDQITSGSGVIDVAYNIYPDSFQYLGGPNAHARVTGYAPTVDLGKKGLLFLTFTNAERTVEEWRKRLRCPLDDIICMPFAAYRKPGEVVGGEYSQLKTQLIALLLNKGAREVPFPSLSKLVRFLDINAPDTEVPVSPDNLEAAFGPDIHLNRVILELTDEPVSHPPAVWPKWLQTPRKNTTFRGYENG